VRVLAHLSDLHFGRIDAAALEPLRRRVVELAPDLVVISGDLTQRARARQFREARAFLDSLPRPQVVVPGNHDVPLYNVLARFLRPLGGYRRAIGADLEPSYVDDEIAVLGVNSARALTFKGGRVNTKQLERVAQTLQPLPPEVVRIVVTHHPFEAPERLSGRGVDMVMSGHAHAASAAGRAVLVVQAGTATSSRTREAPNSFNLLRVSSRRVDVREYRLRDASFVPAAADSFQRGAGGWTRCGPA
jgi:predicted MPP superfamily phosphohydrolase